MFDIYDGRTAFWQWDLNQRVLVNGRADQVHFCNGTSDTSLVVETQKDEKGHTYACVPNILLQSAIKIRVYAYVADDANGEEYTKHTAVFDVFPRTRPETYVYTETEVLNYATLAERIDGLESGGIGGLFPATDVRLGGVKIGNGLNVADDGTISLRYADVTNAQGGRTITIG